MMAGLLLALAVVSGLIGGSGFLVLGVTDLEADGTDPDLPPGTARTQGIGALAVGIAGLIGAVALAFAAGRV